MILFYFLQNDNIFSKFALWSINYAMKSFAAKMLGAKKLVVKILDTLKILEEEPTECLWRQYGLN